MTKAKSGKQSTPGLRQQVTPKQSTMTLLETLPDDISYETILAEIMFKMELLERLDRIERGEIVSHEEAMKRLAKWLSPNGK